MRYSSYVAAVCGDRGQLDYDGDRSVGHIIRVGTTVPYAWQDIIPRANYTSLKK